MFKNNWEKIYRSVMQILAALKHDIQHSNYITLYIWYCVPSTHYRVNLCRVGKLLYNMKNVSHNMFYTNKNVLYQLYWAFDFYLHLFAHALTICVHIWFYMFWHHFLMETTNTIMLLIAFSIPAVQSARNFINCILSYYVHTFG